MNEQRKQKLDDEFNPVYFDAMEVGKNLKEVAVDTIQTESREVMSRWYRSSQEVGVYLWMDHRKNVIKQQVHLYGQLIEWNILDGLRTGVLIEDESQDSEESAEEVRFDEHPLPTSVQQALQIVTHAEQVPERERNTLLENFTRGKTLTQFNRGEFHQKFGAEKESISESFWGKIRRWIALDSPEKP